MKQIVVYFSKAGETYMAGRIKSVSKGNTERMAEEIASNTGADLFPLIPQNSYPNDYNECVQIADQEQKNDARPALQNIPDISQYDVVWIGYPCWWGTYPMAVQTFLDSVDTKGKIIVPFTTHEGSGFGSSLTNLRQSCPGATIEKGLAIVGHQVAKNDASFKNKVRTWCNQTMAAISK